MAGSFDRDTRLQSRKNHFFTFSPLPPHVRAHGLGASYVPPQKVKYIWIDNKKLYRLLILRGRYDVCLGGLEGSKSKKRSTILVFRSFNTNYILIFYIGYIFR
jgi:hypothetical protein